MLYGSDAGWVREPQRKGRMMRALLELAIFAFVLGVGFSALDHLDHAGATIVLGVYVCLTAIGALLAVHYGWKKRKSTSTAMPASPQMARPWMLRSRP
jgi:protein-S-isoprenylcysteine O-methyltransferase Ste14